MSDITEFHTASGLGHAHKVCRVAYTLNNDQPVLCTIVGDQPLFYMDCDVDYEDDDLLSDIELGALEEEIRNIQTEIERFERFSASDAFDSEAIFSAFADNQCDVAEGASALNFATIKDLRAVLSQSRIAGAYLDFADEHGVALQLSSYVEDGEYNRKAGLISVNAALPAADQILMAARELRRHWQHRQGALIHPLMFHPDNAVLINRVQQADLWSAVIRVAWELQLSDYKDAWDRVERSSLGDLARAFARDAFMDFRTINNGEACTAVFESWFLSERCRVEDRKLIQGMLADYQGYVFDLEEAESSITPALIAALGSQPFGKNYLAQHVETIMRDPIFTDVRDRSNANFLWFIKFEKSFRETEQELQSVLSNHKAEAFDQAAFLKDNRDKHYATRFDQIEGSGAEIIQLYSEDFEEHAAKRSTQGGRPGQGGAEIIYLR